MSLNEAKQAVERLDDDEWNAFLSWALNDHRDYRKNRPVIEKAQAEMVVELVGAGKVSGAKYITYDQALAGEKPPSWSNPGTDVTKMFPFGAVVARKRHIYISEVEGKLNSWEPGGEGVHENIWRDITDEVKRAQENQNEEQPPETDEDTEPETQAEPEEQAEPETTGPEIQAWAAGIDVKTGDRFTYNGDTYEVLQPHTTQTDWLPNELPALYRKV